MRSTIRWWYSERVLLPLLRDTRDQQRRCEGVPYKGRDCGGRGCTDEGGRAGGQRPGCTASGDVEGAPSAYAHMSQGVGAPAYAHHSGVGIKGAHMWVHGVAPICLHQVLQHWGVHPLSAGAYIPTWGWGCRWCTTISISDGADADADDGVDDDDDVINNVMMLLMMSLLMNEGDDEERGTTCDASLAYCVVRAL